MSFQKLRPTRRRSFPNITLPSDEAVSTRNSTYKIQGMYHKGLKGSLKYYKRLKNPLIIITSHNFDFNDHATELYKKDEFRVLME